jgi:pyruvate dehydrogenase (quinone)/pyruvate oxidase
MAQNASDILLDTLIDWGVEVIFGLPGDGINGIIEALRVRQDKIRFIQVRHEEAAAFAAVGYAKFSGKLGVCLATSGPGGIHLLNGLYDAKLDGAPVLAITGMQFHDLMHTFTQQDVELDKLFEDVCVYNSRVMGPAHMENVAELACRSALACRGVAHITVPVDFQEMEVKERKRSKRNVAHHVSLVHARSARLPNPGELQDAADILNAGSRVAILAGRGALRATDELEKAAHLLGAPIIKALLGKGAVPDDSPYTTGGIGLLGTRPSEKALEGCDTLLIVGSSFPYIEFMPKPGQARCVQIDLDPQRIGLRYPAEVGLVGDAGLTLQELLPLLHERDDKSFLTEAQEGMKKWRELMESRASREEAPMKPQVIAAEFGRRLPENAITTCDSGTIATWWARHVPHKRGQMHSLSGNLATMAPGLPYAIGAAVAFPDRPVFAFVGDGGLTMLMGELATCAKYKLNVKVIVVKNNSLGQIKWEQMVFLGNPEFGCDLQPIDFTKVAEGCGISAFAASDPKDVPDAVGRWLGVEGPALLEATVDPYEPPMPASVTVEQAAMLAKSLARGETDRGKIIQTIFRDKLREVI